MTLTIRDLDERDALQAKVREQAATIKALADALSLDSAVITPYGWHHRDCLRLINHPSGQCAAHCARARAALRLAGRLP